MPLRLRTYALTPSRGCQVTRVRSSRGTRLRGQPGCFRVNQASGSANAQANVIAIGIGADADALAESVLSSTASGIAPASVSRGTIREAAISDSAFRGARGLVQVNQSAGSGNRTANHFAL